MQNNSNFTIINGKKQEKDKKIKEIKEKKLKIYKRNYIFNLYDFHNNSSQLKAIYFGIKYISKTHPKKLKTYEDVLHYYCDINDIKTLISNITYREFINLFPIIKEYNGERFQCKDYFTVKEYLNTLNLNDKIGLNNIDELFWNYYNNDIMFFVVNEISCLDTIAIMNNQDTLLDRFLKEVDPEGNIHTYTYHEKEGYMYDRNTGKTFKVSKPKKKIKNIKLKLVN